MNIHESLCIAIQNAGNVDESDYALPTFKIRFISVTYIMDQ